MLIVLDSSLDKPLYVQIRDQIRGRIISGDLKPGDRLEPSRELAKGLKVNRTTVGNAYADLEAEGLIQGTVGRGTYVLPLAAGLKAADLPRRRATSDMVLGIGLPVPWSRQVQQESGWRAARCAKYCRIS